MGLVMAVMALGQAYVLGVSSDIATAVSIAVVAICSWAALVAGALPLILRRLGVDPAVVSAPLISTLVDGTGLLIYFEIARIVLKL
jgi:magnesium transporter